MPTAAPTPEPRRFYTLPTPVPTPVLVFVPPPTPALTLAPTPSPVHVDATVLLEGAGLDYVQAHADSFAIAVAAALGPGATSATIHGLSVDMGGRGLLVQYVAVCDPARAATVAFA